MTPLTGFGLTVIVEVPVFPSLTALIVAVPGAIAVTSPVDDTLATPAALVDQTTVRLANTCPAASRGSAVSCVVCPTTSELEPGATATDATGTVETVIVATAFLPSLVAVMIALPDASPVTTPAALTLATAGLPVV